MLQRSVPPQRSGEWKIGNALQNQRTGSPITNSQFPLPNAHCPIFNL
ncbi:hypothetical protein [Tolypothrix sp. VBCCA 56010]